MTIVITKSIAGGIKKMSSILSVYDASAGSGKTYNLSGKFSDYLLEEFKKGNKDVHRFVMAVTFTNKATFEMKSRILDRLYERAKGISKEDKQLSCKDRDISNTILKNLVHDYTMFRISTIDSFFQKVLKAFAVEMGSRSSYDTTLDDGSAVEAAMDSLYSKLGSDEQLRKTVESISLSRIEDEKYWNWRDDLLKICKRVLDSKYQNYKPSPSDPSPQDLVKFFSDKGKSIDTIFTDTVINLVSEIASRFSACTNLKRIEDCLGNGQKNQLLKLLLGNMAGCNREKKDITLNYPPVFDKWLEGDRFAKGRLFKVGTANNIISEVEDIIGDRLEKITQLYKDYYQEYRTLKLINSNIKETSILGFVAKELDEYLSSEQLSLLKRAPKVLADIIDGSDAPFVYDKIGTFIKHYLLDEFQDTSVDQWENFKPLLKEGLDNGNESMIVGDVKQSIYRFRDGKWDLFKYEVEKTFGNYFEKKFLSVNHRSLHNVVVFNNLLFSSEEKDKWFNNTGEVLPGALVRMFMENLEKKTDNQHSGTIANIYKDSAQHVEPKFEASNNKGVVHVISCGFEEEEGGMTRDEFILWDLVRKINYLTTQLDYKPGDIAILTDKNVQCGMVANYLVDNKISIVSGESLKLDSNKVVSLLIEILRKLVNPKDKGLDALSRLYGIELKNLDNLDLSSKAGKTFMIEIRSCNTLYQMCKLILNTFFDDNDLDNGNLAFIKAFLDRTLDYSVSNGTSIPDFLKWWDQLKEGFFIPEPSNNQAVQIMTMHKAKGLGFRVVFIPFLRDNMISYNNFLGVEKEWATIDGIGYKGPLLIPFTSEMKNSLYKDFYFDELMERSIDNLNLAYVTFTRAKERLYVYAKGLPSKEGNVSSISAALNIIVPTISKDVMDFNPVVETLETGEVITDYVLGNDLEHKYKKPDEDDNKEESDDKDKKTKDQSTIISIEASMIKGESSKIRLRGVYDEDDNVRRGVLYHELFSYIDGEGNTEGKMDEKVAKAVDKFLKKNPGSLIGNDADSLEKEVLAMIAGVKEKGYGWFDEGKRIYGEQSIISEEGKNFRPDRIVLPAEGEDGVEVVDYKFGEYEENSDSDKKYHKQVDNYVKLLRKMGYSNVKGFLWYVLEDEVVPV